VCVFNCFEERDHIFENARQGGIIDEESNIAFERGKVSDKKKESKKNF